MDARAISGPTILLRSGNYFDLQDPSASRFEVSDIAHAMSAFMVRFHELGGMK